MKALVLEAYNKLAYTDVPEPECAADEVIIKVKACGICGSDVHGMDGSTGRRNPPIIMGHEAAGVIVGAGSAVKGWKAGDRVTFDSTIYRLDDWYTRRGLYNLSDGRMVLGVSPKEYKRHGAFAEYVAVPQHILYRIPESVSFEQAAMVEPFGVAFHAVELTPLQLADSALVVGAGMIGVCIVQALRLKGCASITCVDLDESRLALAAELGADRTIVSGRSDVPAAVKELTGGRGADAALEAVGSAATVNMAIESVRRGGVVTLVGNITPRVEIPLQAVVTQQIRLQGSCAIAGEYPAVLQMFESGRLVTDGILSAIAPLSEGAAWFERLHKREPGLMKVILKP